MTTTRLVKGSFRWAIPLGSVLLYFSTGCAGPGHAITDTAFDRLLAPAVVSAPPLTPAGDPATDVAVDSGVWTTGLLSGEDKSKPKPAEEEMLPPQGSKSFPNCLPRASCVKTRPGAVQQRGTWPIHGYYVGH
jgi:hypothetical protein